MNNFQREAIGIIFGINAVTGFYWTFGLGSGWALAPFIAGAFAFAVLLNDEK